MLVLIVFMLTVLPGLQASTLKVQQRIVDDNRQFQYQFSSATGELNWQFVLSDMSIRQNSALLQSWVPALINQQLGAALKQQAGSFLLKSGPGGDWRNFQLSGPESNEKQQLRQQLQTFSKQFQQQQLNANGYQQVRLAGNQQLIMVDHVNIIQQSLPHIAPIATSATEQLGATSQRQLLQMLLNWVQQIPAEPAEQAEFGRSYRTPLQVLTEHRADSASKVVLLATILRRCLPQVQQALLYTPDRTLLAIAINAEPGDMTVTLRNNQYLVLDPAAPEQPAAGQAAQQQQLYVLNQYFAYRQF